MSIENNDKNNNISIIREEAGARLRVLRQKKGFTQTELAQKIGFKTGGSVSNLEIGKTPIDICTLYKIQTILEADIHWLITGKPSAAVIRLRPYAACHLAERYQQIQELEKERSDLLVKQSLGDIHTVRLYEIKEEIENLRLYCQTVIKVLNEVLEPIGEKI